MKKILFLLALIPQALFAQVFQPIPQKSNFSSLARDFENYRSQHNLKNNKGWKWYARWENEEGMRRTLGNNNSFNMTLVEELDKISINQNNASKQSGWLPFGPNVLPPAIDEISSHGMGRINCVTFHPTDSNIIYVGVAQGGIWKSINGGLSWTPITDQLPITRISDIAIDPNNPNVIYASVGDYAYLGVALETDGRKRHTHYGIGVYKSIDGGNTWAATGLSLAQNNLDASLIRRVFVNPFNSQELVAAGIEGIWKSYDAGSTWTKKSSLLIWDIERAAASSTQIYASTGFVNSLNRGSAGIIKSSNFGETWTSLSTGIPATAVQRVELAISPADTDQIFAITCGLNRGFEGFYVSKNAGATWTKTYESTTGINLLGWDNSIGGGGQGTYDLAIVCDAQDPDKVYVGGINMWGTDDGGYTWDGMSYWLPYYGEYLHADQHQFAYNPLNETYYVANDGGLYASKKLQIGSWTAAQNQPNYEWPTKWKFLSDGMQITSFYRLALRKRYGDVIAGAQDNSTFYRTDTGWVNMIGGDGMDCALHPTDPLTLYGSAQFGYMVQSFDGGFSFNPIGPSNNENGEWTTPIKLSVNNPETIYLGYENLHKSTDEGLSFNPLSNFPTMSNGIGAVISAMGIASSNENFLYVAKRINHQNNEPMKFYVSSNAGSTWQNRTAGLPDSLYCTSIAVAATVPNKAWACFSGFGLGAKVYKTENAGQSWTNISFNLPNIPMNCLVQDPKTNILYLGTDAGVYYLLDSSSIWMRYSNNLPNVIVSDLEIHTDSNKLFAATFGRGIWQSDLVTTSVGLEETRIALEQVQLYPSITDGRFTVMAEELPSSNYQIQIWNIKGQLMYSEVMYPEAQAFKKEYNLSLLPGMYFYQISSGNQSRSVRFVVER